MYVFNMTSSPVASIDMLRQGVAPRAHGIAEEIRHALADFDYITLLDIAHLAVSQGTKVMVDGNDKALITTLAFNGFVPVNKKGELL